MTALTPEQREYKERTREQLQLNLPLLETKLAQETRRETANSLQKQIDDTRAHIELLEHELTTNTAGEPIADDLCRRAARAVTRKKFFLAKKLINKLETIEPFYPAIDRLREEAEAGRASRRTQAIADRPTPVAQTDPSIGTAAETQIYAANGDIFQASAETEEKRGLSQFLQFHVIVSCLLIALILCVMTGVGSIMLLQWLVEGG